jgi:hypothetical protein
VRDALLVRNPAKDRARRRIVGRSDLPMAAPESPRDFALPDVRTLSRLVEDAGSVARCQSSSRCARRWSA